MRAPPRPARQSLHGEGGRGRAEAEETDTHIPIPRTRARGKCTCFCRLFFTAVMSASLPDAILPQSRCSDGCVSQRHLLSTPPEGDRRRLGSVRPVEKPKHDDRDRKTPKKRNGSKVLTDI
jgi:hypothetical protein